MCRKGVYLSPLDVVTHDTGKQFMARVFQAIAEPLHIETKAVPVEFANLMTFVERYHGPLQRAFHIRKAECPDLHDDEALQLVYKSMNNTAGPDGLLQNPLVYGALPCLGFSSDFPAPIMIQQTSALQSATVDIEKRFPRSQVSNAITPRIGPDTNDIKNFNQHF